MGCNSEFSDEFITSDITIKEEVIKEEPIYFQEEDKADEFLVDPLADLEPPTVPTADVPFNNPVVESQTEIKQIIVVQYGMKRYKLQVQHEPESEPIPLNPVKSRSQIKKKEHSCQLCGKKVSSLPILRRHLKNVHNPNKPPEKRGRPKNPPLPFKCPNCPKMFAKENNLKFHKIIHRSHLPANSVNTLLQKIAAGVMLKKQPVIPEKTIQMKMENVEKPVSKSVNVNDAKEVAKVLDYKTVKVSLLRWNFPPGMIKKYKKELDKVEDLYMDLD